MSRRKVIDDLEMLHSLSAEREIGDSYLIFEYYNQTKDFHPT